MLVDRHKPGIMPERDVARFCDGVGGLREKELTEKDGIIDGEHCREAELQTRISKV